MGLGILICALLGQAGETHALPPGGIPWRVDVIHNTRKGYDGTHVADVNGDSLPDVVSACEDANQIVIALHPG